MGFDSNRKIPPLALPLRHSRHVFLKHAPAQPYIGTQRGGLSQTVILNDFLKNSTKPAFWQCLVSLNQVLRGAEETGCIQHGHVLVLPSKRCHSDMLVMGGSGLGERECLSGSGKR